MKNTQSKPNSKYPDIQYYSDVRYFRLCSGHSAIFLRNISARGLTPKGFVRESEFSDHSVSEEKVFLYMLPFILSGTIEFTGKAYMLTDLGRKLFRKLDKELTQELKDLENSP